MSIDFTDTVEDWTNDIAVAAESFMNATIEIYDPKSTSATPWQPGDTGGVATPDVILTTVARIIRIRRPQFAATADEVTSVHPVRFQIPRDAPIGLIPKGWKIKVINGGEDKALEEIDFVVTVAMNASWRAVRTIETLAEMLPAFTTATSIPTGLFPSNSLFPEGA